MNSRTFAVCKDHMAYEDCATNFVGRSDNQNRYSSEVRQSVWFDVAGGNMASCMGDYCTWAHSMAYAAELVKDVVGLAKENGTLAKQAMNSHSALWPLLSMRDTVRAGRWQVLSRWIELVGDLHLGDPDLPERQPVGFDEKDVRFHSMSMSIHAAVWYGERWHRLEAIATGSRLGIVVQSFGSRC